MTTIIIDNEPQYLEGGPPGVFVPLAEVDVLTAQLTRQLTALTVENATLQMEIEAANIAAGEWEETAAALTAERDSLRAEYERLRATCDEVADERLEQATVSNQLRAERDGLRAQIKNIAWAALKYEDATYKVKAYPSNGQYRRQLKKIHDILKAAQAEFGPEE